MGEAVWEGGAELGVNYVKHTMLTICYWGVLDSSMNCQCDSKQLGMF